jgi:small subunit ribosomal protein S20
MPNLISSKRRARQIVVETARNKPRRSRVHNARKAFVDSLAAGDVEQAQLSFRKYCSALDKAAKHNIIKKNTAIRRKRRGKAKLQSIMS